MLAQIELKNVESSMIKLDTLNLDVKDGSVAIKNVHIGKDGEARNVLISYDKVKRILRLSIYELGGTDVLREFCLANGRMFSSGIEGALDMMPDVPCDQF